MQKIPFLFLFLFAFTIIQAQSITVSPNPNELLVDLNNDPNLFHFVAESIITNNTSESQNYKWVIIKKEKPVCWETSVFGVWIQVIPGLDSLDFELGPNEEGSFNLDIYADLLNGIPAEGEADVVIKITNENNAMDTLLVTFTITAINGAPCTTEVSTYENSFVSIYPNPTKDHFFLEGNVAFEYLEISNLIGKKVILYSFQKGKAYNINDFADGIYIVTLYNKNHQVVKTTKLSKH